jgi:putative nucleotidyltransferase with HDIG domain
LRYLSKPPVIVAFTVMTLTGIMGHRFYNAPTLAVGKIAPQTFYAPATVKVQDEETTEEKRKTVRSGFVAILMIDPTVNQQVKEKLDRALAEGSELRKIAGLFPFVKTSLLSLSSQQYLRSAEEWQWRTVLAVVEISGPPLQERDQLTSLELSKRLSDSGIQLSTGMQKQVVEELLKYRQSVSSEEFAGLTDVITQSRSDYAEAVKALALSAETNAAPIYDKSLLDLPDPVWKETLVTLPRVADRILTQGISPGLPTDLLQTAIVVQLQGEVPRPAQSLSRNLLMATLQPNLTKDEAQTRLRAERAAEEVKPEMVSVQQGEVIVWAGEPITQPDFVLLDHFNLSRRGIDWLGLIGFGGLVSGAVAIFWLLERRFHPGLRGRDYLLVGLLAASTPLMMLLGVPAPNLSVVGLLAGSFYGSVLGVTVVGLLTLLLPMGIAVSWSALLSSAAGGILGGLIAGRLRSRGEFALLGGVVGITQGFIYLLIGVLTSPAWYTVLGVAVLQGLAGLVWGIVALGVSPYLEHLFDLVTPIRLIELTSPNCELLKRLAQEAPGTFQHTLFVSTLAEAAARALGCNVELVRAGTLYHDIGKLHDPLGFIENQMGGPNKHDQINDPYKSADIIKKHVSAGLVMARRYRLPKAIRAFIPEHQGTMLIAYFYHQALQKAQALGEEAVQAIQEADFRYDGPIPQSRETGILMLADSCEAALRSLKDANSEEALAMINRILRARWQDNQLVDSGLSREEMSQIAAIFVQVWQQFNHQRIAYPKLKSVTSAPIAT